MGSIYIYSNKTIKNNGLITGSAMSHNAIVKPNDETILNEKPAIDWFEIITENYLVPGGKPLYYLEKI